MNPEAAKLLSHWVSPQFLSLAELGELQSWFKERPRAVRQLHGFLQEEKAKRLAESLTQLSSWTRYRCRMEPDGTLAELDESDWASCSELARFSCHSIIRPIQSLLDHASPLRESHISILREFVLFFIVGPGFRTWLEEIVGQKLSGRLGCEIARYESGDFISEHTDALDGRVIGFNIYLGSWSDASGGILNYRNEKGAVTKHAPVFNSAALLPITPDCCHWVTPWVDRENGRETISLSFRPS